MRVYLHTKLQVSSTILNSFTYGVILPPPPPSHLKTNPTRAHPDLNVKITSSLKFSGDAELNLGPYEIIRSVQGSFNQSYVALFGKTAGKQYSCITLFSIYWSVVRDISNWTSVDLNYILVQGEKLYKSLKFCDYLNVNQFTVSFERTANLDILEEILQGSITVYGESSFFDAFTVSNVNTSSCYILFLRCYAIALFIYVYGSGNVTSFLIDSHCSGIAVVLQMCNQVFQFLSSFKAYLKPIYLVDPYYADPKWRYFSSYGVKRAGALCLSMRV